METQENVPRGPYISDVNQLEVWQQIVREWEATEAATGASIHMVYLNINLMLHPDYNPRRLDGEDEKQLVASLRKFGLTDALPVNVAPGREGMLIGGNQRVSVIQKHGLEIKGCIAMEDGEGKKVLYLPAILRHLDLEAEKELNLRLNRNQGKWDMGKLNEGFSLESLKAIGFQSWELGSFGKKDSKVPIAPKATPEAGEEPAAPKPTAKPRELVKYEIMIAPETRDRLLELLDRIKSENDIETNDGAFNWIVNHLQADE